MMPSISNAKKVLMINGASTTNAGTVTGSVDTRGYAFLTIDFLLATSDNTTNNPSVLKLSHSDTTDATNYSDITEFVGDGTGGFTIPACITAATSITQPFATFNVDLRGKKRHLKLTMSPVTTQISTALAQLTRAGATPATTDQATVVVNG